MERLSTMEATVPPHKAQNSQLQPTYLYAASIWIAMIATLASAQDSRPTVPELRLPYGPITRLASPDGSRILYGVPYQSGLNDGPQLWIEDTRAHQKEMLLSIGSTLSAVWAIDGTAFSVQDHCSSSSARAYIYDAKTLQRLDLGSRILAADPEAKRFADGHAYFDLDRWEGTQQVIVRFHGHTDEAPVLCFAFSYRVSRTGAVEKLSQRVSPLDQENLCEEG